MKFYSVRQTAEAAGVGEAAIRARIRRGDIKAQRAGRDWIIQPAEYEKVKAAGRQQAGRKKASDG